MKSPIIPDRIDSIYSNKKHRLHTLLTSSTFIKFTRYRFAAIVGSSFILMPLLGHAAAVFFQLVSWNDLQTALEQPFLPLYVGFMFLWSTSYALRLLAPIQKWKQSNPNSHYATPEIHQRLKRFTSDYWGFYLCYVLIVPQIYFWSTTAPASNLELVLFSKIILLQLVVAILIGLPLYMLAMTTLGRLVKFIGISAPLFSIKTNLMLVGGFIPLLTNSILLLYFWNRNGLDAATSLPIFLGLTLISMAITLLSVISTSRALNPVQEVLYGTGSSSYDELAKLRPQSTDEIGYLTQTLSTLFQNLGDQRSHMRAIFDTASEGIIVTNQQGLIISFNPAAERLFELRAGAVIGQPISRICPNINLLEMAKPTHAEHQLEVIRPDNSKLTVELRISEMQQSNMQMFTCMVVDITERKNTEKKLRDAESRYRDLVETAHDLVWSIDAKGHWIYLNQACSLIYGYQPDEMLHRHFTEFSSPEYRERDREAFASLLNNKELLQYETIHLDRNGTPHQLSFNATAMVKDGKVMRIRGTARDISEQKIYEQQLAYQAEHDSLTGLYNRNYFQQELERLIARTARSGANSALFYIDLDQFKYVNDTLGHASGDELLLETTEMLKSHCRDGDLLARFGGDEFTLLLYNIDISDAEPLAEKLRLLFEQYKYNRAANSFNITCSIGITIIDNHSISADEILAQADLSCNLAKSHGRNRIYIYDPEDRDKLGMAEDMGWAAKVREVLDNDRFQIVYQPIVGINNGEIHSYEVLIRMPYADGQTILPGGFMPAAERFGLIHSIDRWMVAKTIRTLANFRDEGLKLHFGINLSGRAFEDATLLPLIKAVLEETGLDPSWLTFEITETAAIANLNAAIRFISALRDIGCRFALDDFGSGFCSFTYLKHLPVDTLKIDGSFIQGLPNAPVDQAMVKSMNEVAHALGKKTIAESVENIETLDLLKELGVDFAQGHYLGKPSSKLA